MRFHALIVVPSLALAALSACATTGSVPPSPSVVADKTVLDERAELGAELAYQAFRTAAEVAVDAGVLKGANASRVADIDARAYQALMVARAAYDTGNAATYASALDNARNLVSSGLALVKGPAQ